ncbi:MAG: tetratricopeptide repeat protein [Acidobacteria bacterium]|nr:tetratricopeptide repeat protein [Acidobacteriota bacterium]
MAQADAEAKPNDPAVIGRFGMVLHAHEQLAGAAACYQRALELEPARFDWPYLLARAAAASGDTSRAAAMFEQSLRLRPESIPARLGLGDAELTQGRNPEAARAFQAVLDRDAKQPQALFGLGRATNQPANYEKALAIYPAYGAAIFAWAQHLQRSGQPERAQAYMAQYPKLKTSGPPLEDGLMEAVRDLNAGPSRLLRQAQSAEAQGQLAAAVQLQLQALQLDPKLAQAHVNLISLYARLNQPKNAEAAYRAAIALAPNSADAYYNYGVLSGMSGQPAEARRAFERSLAIDPGNADAHHNLGALLQESGQLAAAARQFEQAIALNPAAANSHFQLGRLQANQKRYAEALSHLEKAAQSDDQATPTYLYALGATQARAGNREGARASLRAAFQQANRWGQLQLANAIDQDLARLK